MKIVELLFIVTAYALLKTAVLVDLTEGDIGAYEYPTLDVPTLPESTVGECNLVLLCLNVVADVLVIALDVIIFLLLFLFALIVYIVALLALIAQSSFTGIEGAPWYVNVVFSLPILAGLAVIVYKSIRKGASND